jgi:hypothetical protein
MTKVGALAAPHAPGTGTLNRRQYSGAVADALVTEGAFLSARMIGFSKNNTRRGA